MRNQLISAAGERLLAAVAPFDGRPRLRVAVQLLLLAPAALLLALVVYTIQGRISFPFDFDWLEGSQIYHAQRLLQGQEIYRVATEGFLPHPYPPVHIALVAAAGALFGLDYGSARAVSVVALVIAAVVLSFQVWRHWPGRGGRALMAMVAAGYLAGTYGMAEGWYDSARVDSLALVFVVLAAAPLAGDKIRWSSVALSALFAALAVYTKQTTAVFAVALCIMVARRDWAKGLALAAALGALCTVALVVLEQLTRGGFSLWLLNTRHHTIIPVEFWKGVVRVVSRAPFLLLLPLLLRRAEGRGLSARSTLWLGLLIAAVPASLLPFAKQGGAINSLIPIWFLAGPTALLIIGDHARAANAAARRGIISLVLIFQAVYLSCLVFDPAHALPDAAERRRVEAMSRVIASLEGGLVCPIFPMLPARNGHLTPQASWISHADAMWARMPGVTAASYVKWLHGVRPRWLLLTGDKGEVPMTLLRTIGASYRFERVIPAPRWSALWLENPVPRMLYRRAVSPSAAGAARDAPR